MSNEVTYCENCDRWFWCEFGYNDTKVGDPCRVCGKPLVKNTNEKMTPEYMKANQRIG